MEGGYNTITSFRREHHHIMTAAQAQAQALAAATEVQSLQVVKALIRLSVHQLCSLRGLFPDDAFNSRTMAGLDNMHELKVCRAVFPPS